jgi:hypothetical protein
MSHLPCCFNSTNVRLARCGSGRSGSADPTARDVDDHDVVDEQAREVFEVVLERKRPQR